MTTDVTLQGDRYEISVDGARAGHAQFADSGDQRIFFHTEVGDEYAGRGVAGELVGQALDATRKAGKRVVPVCEYVEKFVEKHEEYGDLVDPVTDEARATATKAGSS